MVTMGSKIDPLECQFLKASKEMDNSNSQLQPQEKCKTSSPAARPTTPTSA
jgi:hypothetical protein